MPSYSGSHERLLNILWHLIQQLLKYSIWIIGVDYLLGQHLI